MLGTISFIIIKTVGQQIFQVVNVVYNLIGCISKLQLIELFLYGGLSIFLFRFVFFSLKPSPFLKLGGANKYS